VTKEEAHEVLRLHNICRIHGTTMYEDKDSRNLYANAMYGCGPYFYCPTCRQEEAALADVRIAEAKKVLGL
jgi:hypothetical protein